MIGCFHMFFKNTKTPAWRITSLRPALATQANAGFMSPCHKQTNKQDRNEAILSDARVQMVWARGFVTSHWLNHMKVRFWEEDGKSDQTGLSGSSV